jgi:hypothetical protein
MVIHNVYRDCTNLVLSAARVFSSIKVTENIESLAYVFGLEQASSWAIIMPSEAFANAAVLLRYMASQPDSLL